MKRAPGDPLPKLPTRPLRQATDCHSGTTVRRARASSISGAVRKSRVDEDWGATERAASKDAKWLNHAQQRGVLIEEQYPSTSEDQN